MSCAVFPSDLGLPLIRIVFGMIPTPQRKIEPYILARIALCGTFRRLDQRGGTIRSYCEFTLPRQESSRDSSRKLFSQRLSYNGDLCKASAAHQPDLVKVQTTTMHIPDGYLSPATCAVLYGAAAPFWYTALQRVKKSLSTRSEEHTSE